MVKELGAIVARPSEKGQFTGRFRVEIPATGEFKPRGSMIFRGGGGSRISTGRIEDAIAAKVVSDKIASDKKVADDLKAKKSLEASVLAAKEQRESIQSRTIGGQLESAKGAFRTTGQIQELGQPPSFSTEAIRGFQRIGEVQELGVPTGGTGEEIRPGVSARAGASFLFKKGKSTLDFLNIQGAKILPTTEETQERILSRLDETEKEFILGEIEKQRLVSTPKEDFLRGVGTGVQDFIAEKPATTALLFSTGTATGFALKGVGLGVSTFGGATASALFESSVTVGGLGLAGLETFKIGKEVFFTSTAEGRGEVIGEEFVKIGAFGGGVAFGSRKFDTVLDFVRTRGLKEVSAESVIASEFFQGQTFPQVKKGQTAGEFRQEFFNIKLPGEKPGVARGFTASPGEFKSSTIIQPGTSEVPGLFSAPDISPFFLRVQTERKLVGFGDFIGGSKPTVLRLEFKDLKFAPGVTPRTTAGGSLSSFKTFFESQKGTGETFLPFAKREKEVITVADTAIGLVDKRFFFKFGGRKIPIKEFEVLGKGTASITNQKVGGISTISSELAIGRSTPTLSPLNLIIPPTNFDALVRRGGGSGRRPPSISDLSLTNSFTSDKSDFRSSFGSSDFTFEKRSGGDSFGDFGKIGGIDGFISGFDDSSGGKPRQPRDLKFPPFSEFPDRPRKEKPKKKKRVGRRRKSDDSKRKVRKIKDIKKRRKDIRPSFTAITLGIETGLPKETILGGIAPFDIRGLAIKKKSKKKK